MMSLKLHDIGDSIFAMQKPTIMRRLPFLLLVLILLHAKETRAQDKETLFLSLLEKGKSEFKKTVDEQDFSVAVKYLEEAEKIKPENQEVHYFLGYAYERLSAKDGGKMPDSKLDLIKRASEQFKKVIAISPRYEGARLVLDPYSKLTGIWGSMAMAYLTRGKIDSAVWAFKYGQSEGGYYPAILEYDKDIIASCEKDAILFTNGDNDTYPMWFLQLVERYRQDITVVNLSLLNAPWYMKQLKNAYPFGPNNIAMRFNDAEIDTLAATPWSEDTVQVAAAHDSLNETGKIAWVLKPTIRGQSLRVQDKMIIHIMESNNWKRPICFSATVEPTNRIGLEKFLTMEGLVFRLISHQAERVSKNRFQKNCFEVYTYQGIHDEHLRYMPDIISLYDNYRSCFATLASAYYRDGELDQAKHCIEAMNEKMPEAIIPYSSQQLKEWIEAFYKRLTTK